MNTNQKKTNPTLSRWNYHVKTRLVYCFLGLLSIASTLWSIQTKINSLEAACRTPPIQREVRK